MKKLAVVDIDGILWNMADVWYKELIKVNPDCLIQGKQVLGIFIRVL